MRQSSKILAVANDVAAKDFLDKLVARAINYYQALGLESGDFASVERRNAVVTVQVERLLNTIESAHLTEHYKALLHQTVDKLVRHLLDPEKRAEYDQELSFSSRGSPTVSIPMSPLISKAAGSSPLRAKQEQRELDQLLGGNIEEHSVAFKYFLQGDSLPVKSPVNSQEDLSNIKLLDTYKGGYAVNADLLLQTIKDQPKRSFENVLKIACRDLNLDRKSVETPKQQLWVLLKSENQTVKDVVKSAIRDCFPDAKPASPSPHR
jgi:hypothetical protein